MVRPSTEALDSSNVASLRERSPISTLFSAGRSANERGGEDPLVRTNFGRVVSESFPTVNEDSTSKPLILMLVSFWKDPSSNRIAVSLGVSVSQGRRKGPLAMVSEETALNPSLGKTTLVKASPETVMEVSFWQVVR